METTTKSTASFDSYTILSGLEKLHKDARNIPIGFVMGTKTIEAVNAQCPFTRSDTNEIEQLTLLGVACHCYDDIELGKVTVFYDQEVLNEYLKARGEGDSDAFANVKAMLYKDSFRTLMSTLYKP